MDCPDYFWLGVAFLMSVIGLLCVAVTYAA